MINVGPTLGRVTGCGPPDLSCVILSGETNVKRLPETMGIIRNATLCHEMKGFYCSVSKSPYQWQSAIVTSELKD
ncbi:hypothetical protein C0Q70_15109 [Pomacea canaliculata]|uniref:Uncharacterized protein n=1 Tax=Pomacea canaliculata TaxID=400727 RepID=A0A2T7NTY9_POMCA|nr:hypothetical protein C0Q70_15109 [Pomacea canaliculata]